MSKYIYPLLFMDSPTIGPTFRHGGVFLYGDQPTTCPLCGARSHVLLDLGHTFLKTEIHRCPHPKCRFVFVMEVELDWEGNPIEDPVYDQEVDWNDEITKQ